MKTFSININGRERPVRYTSQDAVSLSRRFGKPFPAIVMHDVLGRDPVTGAATGYVSVEAQIAFLTVGLRHGTSKVTDELVGQWLDDLLQETVTDDDGEHARSLIDVIMPAVRAAFYSGYVAAQGRVDIEEEIARVEADLGKAKGATEKKPPSALRPDDDVL